jgi:cellular nucleic acid-binding protein
MNMPPTMVKEWLDTESSNAPPHRCKRIVKEWATDEGAFVMCCADDGTEQTHHLVAMSSLSRRACYKCGNVGHYAEVCSSAERLCYNCKSFSLQSKKNLTNKFRLGKQPGSNHLPRQCLLKF